MPYFPTCIHTHQVKAVKDLAADVHHVRGEISRLVLELRNDHGLDSAAVQADAGRQRDDHVAAWRVCVCVCVCVVNMMWKKKSPDLIVHYFIYFLLLASSFFLLFLFLLSFLFPLSSSSANKRIYAN